MQHRRPLAVLIRARQEAAKRIERLLPGRPRVIVGGAEADIDLCPRGRPALPDHVVGGLLEEASAVRSGRFQLFGGSAVAFATTGDWRAHPVSGQPTPLRHWSTLRFMEKDAGGDVKEIWELNRHRGLLRLAQAWYLTGDDRWVEALGKRLDDWIVQNPVGMGINWASSLEVAFRAVAWVWIRQLTAASTLWTPARDAAFHTQLWHHGRHVATFDSVHHSPNTHLTGEALALAWLGRCYPEWPRAGRWRRLGESILLEELDHQVLEDGFHYERSPGYHRYTVEFYLLWLVLLRHAKVPLPEAVVPAATRMVEAMLAVRRPDGLLPGIGDEDGGLTLPLHDAHPREPAPLLALGAVLLDRPDWAGGLPPEAHALGWWSLPTALWTPPAPTAPSSRASTSASLPSAGYHMAREAAPGGWWCLVDAGPHGGRKTGHAHTDVGHVEIVHDRDPLVADPGSLCYSGDVARRRWDRSEQAHAMLTVEGAPLAEQGGPFRWLRVAPDPVVRVTRDAGVFHCRLGYRWAAPGGGSLCHERQVVLWPGKGVVVVDWITGVAERAVVVSWPLQVSAEMVTLGAARVELPALGVRLGWTSSGFDTLGSSVEAMEFAATYRTPVPASMLRLTGQGRGDRVVATWFAAAGQILEARVVAEEVEAVSGIEPPLVLRPEFS